MGEFDTLAGLVAQYSPSGQERAAVAWLTARMEALGYDRAFVDRAGNAVGILGEGPQQVVLLGHIDTVPGEIPVREAQAPRRVLFGRGAADAKGPLACFVDAAAKVGARQGWQFIVIGAVEEERESLGARFLVDQYRPDFAIVGEPNQWDRVTLGYKGSASARVTVRRPQAHSASGQGTAAEAAVEAWLKIRAYTDAFNADRPRAFDRLLPTLRGMDSGSTDFEQWARVHVGVRLPPAVPPGDWYAALCELLPEAGIEPGGFAVPAWACEKNTTLVRAFLRAIRSLGGEPRFVYKTGTADLNIVGPAWQCPALVYGPGDSSLDHTPDEHIDLEDFQRAVEILASVLSSLAASPNRQTRS